MLRDRQARLLLRLVLSVMNLWLILCSRFSTRFRSQVTRSVVIELGSEDGVNRRFAFDGASRRAALTGARGNAAADCTLRFRTAELALAVLRSPEAPSLMADGLDKGTINLQGSPALFGWFQGVLRASLPAKNVRTPLPAPYRAPDRSAPHAGYITVEPAVSVLDARWAGAVRAREQLAIWRVGNGERPPRG